MKTTILYWSKAEGKTCELIHYMFEEIQRAESERRTPRVVFITHNKSELDRIKRLHPDVRPDISFFTFNQVTIGALRRLRPKLVLVDNAEFLDCKTYFNEIYPIRELNAEIIIAGTDIKTFKFFRQPEDINFQQFINEVICFHSGKEETRGTLMFMLKSIEKKFKECFK